MSTAAQTQTLAAKAMPLSTSTRAGLLLQRKCACGSPTASLTGECSECKSRKGLQTKLTIGASNDPLEQEADRVADQVLVASTHSAVSGAPPHIQRFTGQATGQADTAPASVDRVLASAGRPLELALRQDMEQHFGHDFANVRVHADAAAEQSARDVNAHAYTVGHDIVFSAGQFAPGTHEGRRLIAHEMTHVVQQSGADGMNVGQNNDKRGLSSIAPGLQREPVINGKDSFHEKAAPDIDKAIAASFITTYVPQKDLKPLKGNMEVLIPTDYEDAYKRWGGSKKDSFEIPGYTDRTAKKKPIKLRTMGRDNEGRNVRPSTIEAAVHEAVHLNSQMQFQTNFPHNYNEGVTQHFTEKILGGAGAAYRDEIKLAQGLIKALGSGGEDLVAKAYFKGDKEPYATILRGFMQDPNHLHKHEWEVAAEKDPTDTKTANRLLEDALKFANNPTTSPPPAPPPAPAQSPSPPAVQKKLAINQPGDQFEQEADRVADEVMAAPAHPVVSGTPPRIQRFSGQSNGQMIAAPASVDRVLASPGRPLEPALRQDMGQRFGHDFASVRVHSDTAAEQSAREVNAQAFTAGHDIVFGASRFAPGTHEGRRLLAHELTHVVQQSSAVGDSVGQNDGNNGRPHVTHLPSADARTVQRDKAQEEEEQRDQDRRDRRSTDSRRDRQELGLRDYFDDLDSDWAGRMILGQYLYGGGKNVDVRDDPAWTAYMTMSQLLKKQVWQQVIDAAKALVQRGKPGRQVTLTRFPAKIENGEGIIGYQYLHGTNKDAGDFFVVGFGELIQFQGLHSAVVPNRTPFAPPKLIQQGPGTRVDFELSFIWNDIIDPNGKYDSDKIKSALAYVLTLGQPRNYKLSIGWRSTCSVWLPASGVGQQVTGGYPAL